jgi:hypothetical protein
MINRKYLLVLLIFFVFASTSCANPENKNKSAKQNSSRCDESRQIDFVLPDSEILSAEIDSNGGVLQGKDEYGQWVIVNIPPGAVSEPTKLDLSFRNVDFEANSGKKSPTAFVINPDIDFEHPIEIFVLYEDKYTCDMNLITVPYLIEDNNVLRLGQLLGIYRMQNIFKMRSFHGGAYFWTYAEVR